MKDALLTVYRVLYDRSARPLLFRQGAQTAHGRALDWMRRADSSPAGIALANTLHRLAFRRDPVEVGGVTLPYPVMVAAGGVKGDGFESEADALAALQAGRNVMPGWRSMPALAGPVEFGSFTRWPRMGNPGCVLWRDEATRSTQNRIGLKNPGAEAAAEFLARRSALLPDCWGINLAVSPGVSDPDQEEREVVESLGAFLRRGVQPSWWTLNLSCPNTEDDPLGHQTGESTRRLGGALIAALRLAGQERPLWVKVSPALGAAQYRALMEASAEVGVAAIIATNTLPEPSPGDPGLSAGIGGGRLHAEAVRAACLLVEARTRLGVAVDVIGCGGVMDQTSFLDFTRNGVGAAQILSALIFRGPLAGALIATG
jgi:dihydroorotate dehydrogenase